MSYILLGLFFGTAVEFQVLCSDDNGTENFQTVRSIKRQGISYNKLSTHQKLVQRVI